MPKQVHLKFKGLNLDIFLMMISEFPHIMIEFEFVDLIHKHLDLEKLAKKLIAREPIDLASSDL
jgi:hypothetical protein